MSEETAVGWKSEAGIEAGLRTENGTGRSIGYPETVVQAPFEKKSLVIDQAMNTT